MDGGFIHILLIFCGMVMESLDVRGQASLDCVACDTYICDSHLLPRSHEGASWIYQRVYFRFDGRLYSPFHAREVAFTRCTFENTT